MDPSFAGPGASCNILTGCWFWRKTDAAAPLKTAAWAVGEIETANRQNVTFLLNSSPNTAGLIDGNVVQRFREIGKLYKRPQPIGEIPAGWLRR
jgi:alpha-L-fucosidase